MAVTKSAMERIAGHLRKVINSRPISHHVEHDAVLAQTVEAMADALELSNERFDRKRFYTAVGSTPLRCEEQINCSGEYFWKGRDMCHRCEQWHDDHLDPEGDAADRTVSLAKEQS